MHFTGTLGTGLMAVMYRSGRVVKGRIPCRASLRGSRNTFSAGVKLTVQTVPQSFPSSRAVLSRMLAL